MRRGGGHPLWLWVLAVGTPLAGLAVVGYVGYLWVGFLTREKPDEPRPAAAARPDPRPDPGPSAPAKKIWDREEFRRNTTAVGKDHVLKTVGKPDRTHENGSEAVWYYDGATRDPVTGKVDQTAVVTLAGETAVSVEFRAAP